MSEEIEILPNPPNSPKIPDAFVPQCILFDPTRTVLVDRAELERFGLILLGAGALAGLWLGHKGLLGYLDPRFYFQKLKGIVPEEIEE
jgi:hypothetical protein